MPAVDWHWQDALEKSKLQQHKTEQSMLEPEDMKIKVGLQNMNKIIYVLALLMDTQHLLKLNELVTGKGEFC